MLKVLYKVITKFLPNLYRSKNKTFFTLVNFFLASTIVSKVFSFLIFGNSYSTFFLNINTFYLFFMIFFAIHLTYVFTFFEFLSWQLHILKTLKFYIWSHLKNSSNYLALYDLIVYWLSLPLKLIFFIHSMNRHYCSITPKWFFKNNVMYLACLSIKQ